MADLCSRSKRDVIDPHLLITLPFGVKFAPREQLQISIIETFVARFKRVF